MKNIKFLPFLLCLIILLSACQGHPLDSGDYDELSYQTPLIPSREANQGCQWKEFSSQQIGLRTLVQDCTDSPIDYQIKDNKLVAINAAGQEQPLIEVFNRPPNLSPEATLQTLFINQLNPEEQNKCRIDEKATSNNQKRNFTILPTEQYAIELQEKDIMPWNACGAYGLSEGIEYFEFQQFAPNKFAYVRVGNQNPLFDQANITLLPMSTE